MSEWKSAIIYGAFDIDNNLSGYAYLTDNTSYLEFNMLRVIPKNEKKGINAAIIAKILEDNNEKLEGGWYINDGARSIRHETAFQDYLEKYFGFRKAYCKLHIYYRFPVGIIIKLLYPLRKYFNSESKVGSIINSLLKMEEICREQ